MNKYYFCTERVVTATAVAVLTAVHAILYGTCCCTLRVCVCVCFVLAAKKTLLSVFPRFFCCCCCWTQFLCLASFLKIIQFLCLASLFFLFFFDINGRRAADLGTTYSIIPSIVFWLFLALPLLIHPSTHCCFPPYSTLPSTTWRHGWTYCSNIHPASVI